MTTLCSSSQRVLIPSRDTRNNIVVVNSLIDANTDGVIIVMDWAKAHDLVDHEWLEKVLFHMGCKRHWCAMTGVHSKGLHTASHWMTVSVRAIQQRTRCGTGVCTGASSLFPGH